MKKLLAILAGILILPFIAIAAQITVPSAPGANYVLVSTSTGAYQAVATSTLGFQNFNYPFFLSGNATSTLTQFNGGLTAYASSTIGNGTVTGGLTVNGTASSSNFIASLSSATSTFFSSLFSKTIIGDINNNLTTKFVLGAAVPGTPSYANTGGTGDRRSIITTSTNMPIGGTISSLVDGNTTGTGRLYWNNGAITGSSYIRFDFNSQKRITEAKYYQGNNTGEGVWQWQGSNDASSWTNIGATFTLGGASTQTITTLSANSVGYRYYQLAGISGTMSDNPWVFQMEFKLDAYTPPTYKAYQQTYNTDGSTAGGQIILQPNGGSVNVGLTGASFSTVDIAGNIGVGSYAGVNAAPINGLAVSGNVGIGTPSPSAKLHVINDNSSNVGLSVQGASSQSVNFLDVKDSSGNPIFNINSNGNIGVQIASPGSRLDLRDNGFSGTYVESVHADDENPYLAGFFNDTYNSQTPLFEYFGYNNGVFAQGTRDAKDFQFYTGGFANVGMTLQGTTNNLGIGTLNPSAKLSVRSNDTTTNPFSIATTSAKTLLWVDPKGNHYAGGDLPSFSSCGTNPSIASGSNNNAGRIQIGSGIALTSCAMTFADGGWTGTSNAPSCDANIEGGLTILVSASSTPTAITFTGISAFAGDFLTYQCHGF